MTGTIGRKIILEIGDTSPLEQIVGVREKNLSCAGEPIDVTSDEDGGWRLLLDEAAQNEVSISLSGLLKSPALRDRYLNGEKMFPARITYPATGGVLEGTFFLSSYNEGMAYNDAVSFDAELQSSGPVTFTLGSP